MDRELKELTLPVSGDKVSIVAYWERSEIRDYEFASTKMTSNGKEMRNEATLEEYTQMREWAFLNGIKKIKQGDQDVTPGIEYIDTMRIEDYRFLKDEFKKLENIEVKKKQ